MFDRPGIFKALSTPGKSPAHPAAIQLTGRRTWNIQEPQPGGHPDSLELEGHADASDDAGAVEVVLAGNLEVLYV